MPLAADPVRYKSTKIVSFGLTMSSTIRFIFRIHVYMIEAVPEYDFKSFSNTGFALKVTLFIFEKCNSLIRIITVDNLALNREVT